jgi:hypothetical protein
VEHRPPAQGRQLAQSAPYPKVLEGLVRSASYRPGWKLILEEMDRGQGSRGLTLDIITMGHDSYHPERGANYAVHHYFPVPPAAYNERSWRHWIFECLLAVEKHECMEFFRIGGKPAYPPAHGPGNDPYLVLIYGDDLDRRTRFTGEVSPG